MKKWCFMKITKAATDVEGNPKDLFLRAGLCNFKGVIEFAESDFEELKAKMIVRVADIFCVDPVDVFEITQDEYVLGGGDIEDGSEGYRIPN